MNRSFRGTAGMYLQDATRVTLSSACASTALEKCQIDCIVLLQARNAQPLAPSLMKAVVPAWSARPVLSGITRQQSHFKLPTDQTGGCWMLHLQYPCSAFEHSEHLAGSFSGPGQHRARPCCAEICLDCIVQVPELTGRRLFRVV